MAVTPGAARFQALEHARMTREKREREAYARGEPTQSELRASRARHRASAGAGAVRQRKIKRPRNEAGWYDDQQLELGANFLRRALGDNDE